MSRTKIEWTESTWNPVIGCTPTSRGCANCYARTMHSRLAAMGSAQYKGKTFEQVRLNIGVSEQPKEWKKPRMIFVCSMGDLFHAAVPESYLRLVFGTMMATPRHTYQVLTKRSERLLYYSKRERLPSNVWFGVSVEDQQNVTRIYELLSSDVPKRFVSFEPLLAPVIFPSIDTDSAPVQRVVPGSISTISHIDWVIVGGESGPKARPMQPEWVRAIRDECVAADKPFFFKQWGGTNKRKAGRLLDGKIWDEIPFRDSTDPKVRLDKGEESDSC